MQRRAQPQSKAEHSYIRRACALGHGPRPERSTAKSVELVPRASPSRRARAQLHQKSLRHRPQPKNREEDSRVSRACAKGQSPRASQSTAESEQLLPRGARVPEQSRVQSLNIAAVMDQRSRTSWSTAQSDLLQPLVRMLQHTTDVLSTASRINAAVTELPVLDEYWSERGWQRPHRPLEAS